MIEQGYVTHDNIIFQENRSEIQLEQNGHGSSSKQTRHFNLRHFFVTDELEQGEVRIEYCGTGKMIADFFTKLLQGGLLPNSKI
jgi:hypothetical protein